MQLKDTFIREIPIRIPMEVRGISYEGRTISDKKGVYRPADVAVLYAAFAVRSLTLCHAGFTRDIQ